jgi:hypothetical protein
LNRGSIYNLAELKTLVTPLQIAASIATSAPPKAETGIAIEGALRQALPVPDIVFGGIVLVLVIMFHAFWIRLISGAFLKSAQNLQLRALLWRSELLFAGIVMSLLLLHLAEIMLWTAALVFSGIVDDWSRAAYFAANCYTALGEPFSLPTAWRIVPPIIAISGIFTFAWTASVLVDFVSRYNDLRAGIMSARHRHPDDRKRSP